ncbi:hypothetical protein PHJA_002330100 [Phtheirospermum japonicum]|uniref:Uncharacterized protein n=1 Tax=Phtheirospermum japonicum TaxID=374723 RepID=A0A830CPS1_9LAMI|nr:hypothetical protein PHJA_002330100 [Phtheirospermum japonicum]
MNSIRPNPFLLDPTRARDSPIMPSIPVLGKRKDTHPCRSQSPDETEEEEKEEAYMGSSEVTKEASGGGEKEEEEDEEACVICLKEGHSHFRCPWKVEVPSGPIPVVGWLWTVACKRCGGGKFSELLHCTNCACSVKYVKLKKCSICWRIGHLDNDEQCPLYGKELIVENDHLCPSAGFLPYGRHF